MKLYPDIKESLLPHLQKALGLVRQVRHNVRIVKAWQRYTGVSRQKIIRHLGDDGPPYVLPCDCGILNGSKIWAEYVRSSYNGRERGMFEHDPVING